jgi:hypothetical protein
MAMMIPETVAETAMLALPPIDSPGNYKDKQKALESLDDKKIDPHEVGQVIVQLQEEIKIIKLQLENLPGYSTGK